MTNSLNLQLNCRRRGQPLGKKYFLMLSPSVLNRTLVPRSWRICFLVRLIMPWRLPRWAYSTLPVPVTLKRFLAPDLVLILGILALLFRPRPRACARSTGDLLDMSVLDEHFAA